MMARFSLRPAAAAATLAVAVAIAGGTFATVVGTQVSNVQIDDWQMQGTATHAAWPVWRLRIAAAFGNVAAREALADVLVSSAQVDERREGVELYRRLALDGVPAAQGTLGHLLLRGLPGIAPDYAQSRRWLSVAASHDAQAAYDLSALYRNGYGVARNPQLAIRWLEQAAQAGLPLAQFQLANEYRFGATLPHDDALALQWLTRAANAELPEANLALAIAYRNGELGMARDEDEYWAHVKETEHDLKHVSRP
ncbi:sel1 repeat family protein [Paraburkholderia fungorum]|jgi:TPR repeat protein|uniref:Sel1 repeat family protein n=1 Tax=Paraburkholderia fungorum TaxID=134537 RepID=A0AAU8T9T6_9BURK|nr:tetratricopeptide repeat protein [Paraburkholderia fungorum]AJZ63148.1 sel1 repeat family protein [Paraburkholderia fungorum]USU20720.1 sel1 repeat family protein [Paraburkholderia fungorum]USU27283.1 sel1 repeat family protein [Paraburkholderia fungorum]